MSYNTQSSVVILFMNCFNCCAFYFLLFYFHSMTREVSTSSGIRCCKRNAPFLGPLEFERGGLFTLFAVNCFAFRLNMVGFVKTVACCDKLNCSICSQCLDMQAFSSNVELCLYCR